MLRHNLLLIFRSFKKDKSTFLINLIGLSTGLACASLIFLWAQDELSIDHFNEKDVRLYQVMQNIPNADGIRTIESTHGLLAKALAEEMPEVESAISVIPASWFPDTGILSFEETRVKTKGQYVGNGFFQIFSYDFVQGDKNQLLNNKYNIAISEELAMKLFHTTDNVIGKTVAWDHETMNGQFIVMGIFKNIPLNASEQFDLVFNYELFFENRPGLQSWGNSDPYTYLLLKDGTNISEFNDKIAGFLRTKDESHTSSLFVRKYSDKYLYNHFENGVQAGGRIEYVRLFSLIAIFILAIACVNFMNLSTAKASRRLKEVGVKKAVGAGRKTLIAQYLGESMLMALVSMFMAILLVELFLPRFNAITGKHLELAWDGNLILSLLAVTYVTGLVAGSYPAFYLSGFNPVTVLKGKLNTSMEEVWTRKGLVVFQFVISVILIAFVGVVYKQIEFVQTKNLGYDRDNILHFEMEMKIEDDPDFLMEGGIWEKRVEAFLHEVENIPGIVDVSNYYHDLTGNHGGLSGVDWEPGDHDEKLNFSNLQVGYDFIKTLGIEMVDGRSFSREFSSERSKVILNKAAIDAMGLSDPVGKTIKVWGQEKEIIGVAGDFHYESLYEEVKPCLFQLELRSSNIMAKIKAGTESVTIAQLQELYHQYYSGLEFDYQFLDNDYQALYTAEKRVSILSRYFAGLTIVISCLGLFGLAAFTAERKIKEIGIRKVLGSSEWKIIKLLSGDFAKMVLLAIVIALPLSFYMTKNWLDNFAYKIDLEWWYFLGTGLLTMIIALLTVSFQSVKAALANPVESLRSE
ncbi:ABC transporter permease [Negadavirga shengliensis]|uniref:ABC transporter permease n=1 Tax=Negadavirga shengliensis TaxID=1389218 RepID=A0ABV9SW80_9BACT